MKAIHFLQRIKTYVAAQYIHLKKFPFSLQTARRLALVVLIVLGILMAWLSQSEINEVHSGKSAPLPVVNLSPQVGETLNDMQAELAQMDSLLTQGANQKTLQSLTESVNALKTQLQSITPQTVNQLEQVMQENSNHLQASITSLSGKVDSLETTLKPVKYLSPHVLPFHVVAIDSIEQQAVVTLSYSEKMFPVEVGDCVAGWSVVRADYSEQRVEFENKESEYVRVNLTGNGGAI